MPISRSVLGINARNYLYIRKYNRRKWKLVADDKLDTKKRLLDEGVPTPGLLAEFQTLQSARDFDWKSLPSSFVLKPAHGYGGRGIVVVNKWDGQVGMTSNGEVTQLELESEVFGAIDGAHSLKNLPDSAFIEDCIQPHSFFKKYTHKGIPDIRVIVCNGIPVMAMARIPTVSSSGKANLHLGAVGVGIDMRTGITTFGVVNGHLVKSIPDKKLKVRGIKIPDWEKILLTAVKAQKVSRLGFVGIDIVLDQERGPLVLEINARPGLSIQIANQESLRTRLERVEELKSESAEKAVELARQLFAVSSLEAVDTNEKILGVIEKVTIISDTARKTVRAKIDTGAYRTSIDVDLVDELELDTHHKLVHVKSGSGRQKRRTVRLRLRLKGKEIKTIATYTERREGQFPIIIGRRDLKDFLVDPNKVPEGMKVR